MTQPGFNFGAPALAAVAPAPGAAQPVASGFNFAAAYILVLLQQAALTLVQQR